MIRTIAAAAALAALAASGAQAKEVPFPEEASDGFYTTLEEIRANSLQTFRSFAADGEGPIPRQDFVSAEVPPSVIAAPNQQALLGQLFGVLDENDDGMLTRAEWEAQLAEDLRFLDENEDGRVTVREMANARENIGFGDALGMLF